MKLEHLEYLCRITPGMSLNMLSEKMHISQQGLSSAIITLEREMECTLLERTNKGVYFTQAGEKLVHHTKIYLSSIQKIKLAQNPIYENLSVSILPNLVHIYMGKFISQYMSENHNINLSFSYHASIKKCIEQVAHDRTELAFVVDIKYAEEPIINTTKLALEYNCIFYPFKIPIYYAVECHKNLLPFSTDQVFLKELSNKICIANAQPSEFEQIIQRILNLCNCSSPLISEPHENIYLERLMNQQGYGLAILTNNYSGPHQHDLKRIQLKDLLSVEVGYVVKKDSKPSLAAQRFIDMLVV